MLRFYIAITVIFSCSCVHSMAQMPKWVKGGSLGSWRLIHNFDVLPSVGHLATGEEYGVIRISSLQTGNLLHIMSSRDTSYFGLKYLPQHDHDAIAIAHWADQELWKSKIQVYDVNTYTVKREIQGDGEFWQRLPSHLEFSSDGELLAIAAKGESNTSIVILSYTQGTEIKTIVRDTDVQDILFWDNNTLLVAEEREVQFVDINSGMVVRKIQVFQQGEDKTSPIQSIVVSMDKRYLLVSQKNSPRVEAYEIDSGTLLWTANGANINDDMVFLPLLNSVAIPSPTGVEIRNVQSGKVNKSIESNITWPSSVLYDNQNQQIIIGSRDGDAEARDMNTGGLRSTLSLLTGYPDELAFLNEQSSFVVLAGGILTICNKEGNVITKAILGESSCFALHRETNLVAFEKREDHSLQLATLNPFKIVARLEGHQSNILDIEFSPDGTNLVSTSEDGQTILWDAVSKQKKKVFPFRGLSNNSITFTGDGNSLYMNTEERVVYIYQIPQDKLIKISTENTVVALAITADSQTLAVATLSTTIIFYNTVTGEQIGSMSPEQGQIHSMVFHNNGRYLFVAGQDNNIILWDTKNHAEIHRYTFLPIGNGYNPGIACMSVSADNQYILAATNDVSVAMWDIGNYTSVHQVIDDSGMKLSCKIVEPDILRIVLSTDKPTTVKFSIYNSRGQVVYTLPIQYLSAQPISLEYQQNIHIPHLVSGHYFLQAEMEDRVIAHPFIIAY